MHNMHKFVKYCVPLIEGSISQPFHDVASPNLVARYYMIQKITSANVAMEIIVTTTTE